MEDTAIDAVGVRKTFENADGLRNLDLHVPAGAVVGLIGPSGAGKTTAVRLITGLLTRQQGDLTVLGSDPDNFDTVIRSRIGYLPQDTLLYPKLSVRENLEFLAATYGLWGRRRAAACEAALTFVELEDVQDRRLEKLSGGMRRRAGLAAALVHEPQLLVLDEPTAGQDPILRRTLWQSLAGLSEAGRTIIVTTQYVDEAGYCDFVALLTDGELVAVGTPDELRRSAYGGELVDVEFATPPSWNVVQGVGQAIGASSIDITGSATVRYTVDDAATSIPSVVEAAESLDAAVAGTDRSLPDFDETFVRLVDKAREGQSA